MATPNADKSYTVRKTNSPDWKASYPTAHVCFASAQIRAREIAAHGPETTVWTCDGRGNLDTLVASYSGFRGETVHVPELAQ
jgi:hypothetical protein